MKSIDKLFFAGILIFIAAVLPAEEKRQDTFSVKQPLIESYNISPDMVGSGDLFTMTLILNHENSADVEFPLKEKPDFLVLWRGPYIRSFIDTDKDGFSVRKVSITTTFKPQNPGRFIVPPLSVFVDSKRFETEPRLLRVGLYKNRKL
jgi:hypothetical protein